MIVFSDLHLKADNESIVFDEVLSGVLDAALKTETKEITFLGDWYDVRNSVLVRLQNRTFEWLLSGLAQGVSFRLLPGNHDQVSQDGSNALQVFGGLDGVTVYSRVTIDNYGVWVPYGQQIPELTAQERNSPIWAHADIIGAKLNSEVSSDIGWGLADLTDRMIITGHYHRRQVIPNGLAGSITYVGSPFQTKFDERENECGYHVYDRVKRELRFVEQHWGPKHHNLRLDSGDFVIPENFSKRDKIQVVAPMKDLDAIRTKFVDEEFSSVKLTPLTEEKITRLAVSDPSNLGEYAVQYVEQFKGDLPEEALLKHFVACKEAVEG